MANIQQLWSSQRSALHQARDAKLPRKPFAVRPGRVPRVIQKSRASEQMSLL